MNPNGTAIVTGGASGIGLAAVHQLLKEDWRVAVVDRQQTTLETAKQQLSWAGDQVRFVVLDVSNEDGVEAMANSVASDFGPIRGVVNSAGIAESVPFLETTVELFRRTIEVNLIGTFLVARAAAAHMRHTGGGAIVNIASVSGVRGSPGRTAYAASKGGVVTLTKVMAVELAEFGIRVNSIAPGPIDTPLVRAVHSPEAREALLNTVPMHRYASPDELAGAISFLLDGTKASYVTGQLLGVDGGLMAGAGWTPRSVK